jgi:beta-mannanase
MKLESLLKLTKAGDGDVISIPILGNYDEMMSEVADIVTHLKSGAIAPYNSYKCSQKGIFIFVRE